MDELAKQPAEYLEAANTEENLEIFHRRSLSAVDDFYISITKMSS